MNIRTFKIKNDQELFLNMQEGVFIPTGTTKVLVEAVCSYVSKSGKLLDLGCGSGAVGITLHHQGVVSPPLHASDVSERAVDCVKKNAASNNCSIVAKHGSLFDPWEREKFDFIIDDVSGIAKAVAENSPWYNNVPCESGADGALLIRQIIKEAPKYLNPKGLFFFPAISFSNIESILIEARDNFSHVEKLSHTEWPLPKEMYPHLDMFKRLQEEGYIQFIERFGMTLYFTDVYVAYQ